MKHLIAPIVCILLCACADQGSEQAQILNVVRMGVLPDQDADTLNSTYRPLADYLESVTSLQVAMVLPADYSDMVAQFHAGQIDLARFGGLTFVQAESLSRAEALVMRGVDLQFTSCYVVQSSDPRQELEEYAAEPFAFGPRLSTSGHLMPRHFQKARGIIPEQFFASIRFSSGHDATVALVEDGRVAIGVANCSVVNSLLSSGRLGDRLRILETTPPYPNYVWAVQRAMSDDVKNSLRNAFMALDASIAEQGELLLALGADAYLPAGASDFEQIRILARDQGLLTDGGP